MRVIIDSKYNESHYGFGIILYIIKSFQCLAGGRMVRQRTVNPWETLRRFDSYSAQNFKKY